MSSPSKIPPRTGPRMPSTVRVRRHESSKIFHFLHKHRHEADSIDSDEQTTGDTGDTTTSSSPEKPKPKRPRLGVIDSDGRVTGRRLSAVEQLVATDQREAAAVKAASGGVLSRQKSRATAGHAPQLSSVTEDYSPQADPPFMDFPQSIAEEDDRSDPDAIKYSQRDNTGQPRPLSAEPVTVPRFLTPLNTRKTTASMTGNVDAPSKTYESDTSTSSSRDNRLRRPMSRVSIPTPVAEESLTPASSYDSENHTDDVADYLDVVDPEVAALGHLSNIGNSIFMPHIPQLYDRRPTYDLPGSRRRGQSFSSILSRRRPSVASSSRGSRHDSIAAAEEGRTESPVNGFEGGPKPARMPSRTVMTRLTSAVGWNKKEDDEEFTKHIKRWRDMDEEERDELDEHVRMLLTKKSKFKRGAKGFWAFVKTPMGFLMTLYGFLVTFWGTAIVLFIFGWIHVGERKRYWIEICDQILCALFACVGLGFAPFRAVDTYRMIHIAHYHHLSWKRRGILGLTDLNDPNDLPRPEKDGSNQVARAEEVVEDYLATTPGATSADGLTDSRHSLLSSDRTNTSHSQTKDKTKMGGHKYKKKLVLPDVAAVIRGPEHNRVAVEEEEEDPTGKTSDLSKGRKGVKEGGKGVKDGNGYVNKEGLQGGKPIERSQSIMSEIVKEKEDVVVLTKGEQRVLEHHQRKLHASHTFYRYHETATHHAFPLDLLIVIVCLLDCHSLLQAALGGCTWGIKYTHRPTALTATLISCSLSCNAVAGLIIYLGGRRTKKREVVERRLKIALEQEALAKIERRRARGELPDRNHGGSDTSDEDQARVEKVTFSQERDQLAKDLSQDESHLERHRSDHLEMNPYTKAKSKTKGSGGAAVKEAIVS